MEWNCSAIILWTGYGRKTDRQTDGRQSHCYGTFGRCSHCHATACLLLVSYLKDILWHSFINLVTQISVQLVSYFIFSYTILNNTIFAMRLLYNFIGMYLSINTSFTPAYILHWRAVPQKGGIYPLLSLFAFKMAGIGLLSKTTKIIKCLEDNQNYNFAVMLKFLKYHELIRNLSIVKLFICFKTNW